MYPKTYTVAYTHVQHLYFNVGAYETPYSIIQYKLIVWPVFPLTKSPPKFIIWALKHW